MSKTIVIVATLDTKGDEARYVRDLIKRKGHKTIVIDSGVLHIPVFQVEFTREEVARAGGRNLQELIDAAHRGAARSSATEVMMRGVAKIVKRLYSDGRLDGIISLGGGTGTAIGTYAMKVLSICVPKLMVSTWVIPEYIGEKDITVMQTPADIMGLNSITRRTLGNAVGAIVGMVEVEIPPYRVKPAIGITALGVTTPAVIRIARLLEERNYESVIFHNKTLTLDELIEEGKIAGVIDLTPSELVKMFIYLPPGRIPRPRSDRLELAGKRGLPQVIAPGGLDMHILRCTPENVPSELKGRMLHKHAPATTLVRTSEKEAAKLGKIIAERANRVAGPVAIAIPMRGFSEVDREGQDLYDPKADRCFIKAVEENVAEQVEIVKVDANINDDRFAKKVVDVFEEISKRR